VLQMTLAMGYGSETQGGGTAGMIFLVVWLVVCLVILAGVWKVFAKAGQPGWGVLVPIYNAYLITRIAQRPAWWLILMFVPIVNILAAVVLSMDIAKHFGKGPGFGVGLAFLGPIFYPILGFGGAQYSGHDSHAMHDMHDMNAPMAGDGDQQAAA